MASGMAEHVRPDRPKAESELEVLRREVASKDETLKRLEGAVELQRRDLEGLRAEIRSRPVVARPEGDGGASSKSTSLVLSRLESDHLAAETLLAKQRAAVEELRTRFGELDLATSDLREAADQQRHVEEVLRREMAELTAEARSVSHDLTGDSSPLRERQAHLSKLIVWHP